MTLRQLVRNLKGKHITQELIQQFVNRQQDYQAIPAHQIEQIVVGDSTARYGIAPKTFSLRTFNAGEISADLEMDFQLVQLLLAKCPHIKRVILFYSFYDYGYNLSKSNNRYLCPLHTRFLGLPKRAIPASVVWGAKLKFFLYSHLKPTRPPHNDGEDFPSFFMPKDDSVPELVDKHIKQATKYGHAPWQWFVRLRDLCAQKGAQLVVCMPPVRSDYYRDFVQKVDFSQVVAPFTQEKIPCINMQTRLPDRLFGDCFHLTPAGARELSAQLEKELQKYTYS